MYRGWTQVAFSRDLDGDVTPATIGDVPLVLVRRDGQLHAFDATCPHRGAHLGYGGRLDGDVVVCPFHGRRIRLGDDAGHPYCVKGYRTLELGGAIYVLLDESHENGFSEFIRGIAATHYLIPGFEIPARISPEYVIENVFDADHFNVVHMVGRRPTLSWRPGDGGELLVEGIFETERPNKWQDPTAGSEAGAGGGPEPVRMHFRARVFSPTLVATEVGSADLPNLVVTSATPTPDGDCVIRLMVAMAPTPEGTAPTVRAVGSLMSGSRTAFEQDLVIWEHLDRTASTNLGPGDELVLAYHDYCRRFRESATL
jgi:phenylpropionate dioxygenase-like ring-hydroxylating dioxygenase large terminal subunit